MMTEIPIITKVNHPMTLDASPLVLSLRILLSFAIIMIAKRIGTATTPLITAVNTNASIASIFVKFIPNPISVEGSYYQIKPSSLIEFFT